jgi:hypothetical protein
LKTDLLLAEPRSRHDAPRHHDLRFHGRLLRDTFGGPVGDRDAFLWKGADDGRADYAHWYHRWNSDWGSYEAAENLSAVDRTRLRELMAMLGRHPFVNRFVPEDGGLLGK